jgi:ATP-dependent exoDNAse (exonuclease V) beta subunit
VSGVLGGRIVNIIVDRTFVDQDGVRWIVDYKTSSHEGADIEGFLDLQKDRYRQQLEKYAALFKNLEHRPIRLGLYFPLLNGWREWEYEKT